MLKVAISIINQSAHPLPSYATVGSAGADLYANLPHSTITLEPMARECVPTGILVALPQGYEAQIRPRSGLAYHHGLTVLNAPGTIDSDYRGELKVLLINLSQTAYTIQNGERIAQLIVQPYIQAEWKHVTHLDKTDRGSEGYGSTGKLKLNQ